MPARLMSFSVLALAALLLGAANRTASAAEGFAEYALLEFDAAVHGGQAWHGPQSGLLLYPAGWAVGDAAALVVHDGPSLGAMGRDVRERLLQEQAAVLELAAGPQPPAILVPAAFAALHALRHHAGAGLVVIIGVGMAGEVALLSADPAQADRHAGADGPRFSAHLHLDPLQARFLPGNQSADAREAWPARASALCIALAQSDVFDPGNPSATVARDCSVALTAIGP
ncbi:hypothetical protein GXW71_17250 [Roseomonas hellenica]|uniref:Alpha/beta hydrolase n=1 Tax=Plastoroseomonas hellenica TaxID=2687306 RepID=A0ABS5F0N1_9PROT|nr:hypothetical protein [Plastoroseomonas hellenica]MBR0666110.1 hypothetical protein [Plastoroseomonas hellenica]